MAKSSIQQFVVCDSKGNIDFSASVEKFSAELQEFQNATKADSFEVNSLVHQVFNENPNRPLSRDVIVGMVFQKMNTTFDNWGKVSKKVSEFLKNSSEFQTKLGQNGGYVRVNV